MSPDVRIHGNGTSVIQLEPLTKTAQDWVAKHVELEGWQWLGTRFACDPRMAEDLIWHMQDAGLLVE